MKDKKITFKRGITRINFPTMETNPYKAIRDTERLKLPKHRRIGFETIYYTGKEGFWTSPNVFIEK